MGNGGCMWYKHSLAVHEMAIERVVLRFAPLIGGVGEALCEIVGFGARGDIFVQIVLGATQIGAIGLGALLVEDSFGLEGVVGDVRGLLDRFIRLVQWTL